MRGCLGVLSLSMSCSGIEVEFSSFSFYLCAMVSIVYVYYLIVSIPEGYYAFLSCLSYVLGSNGDDAGVVIE